MNMRGSPSGQWQLVYIQPTGGSNPSPCTLRDVEELGLSRLFWKQEYVGSNPTVAT